MTTAELKNSFFYISSEVENLAKDLLNLSYKQINFRYADSQWSIGECLEHLMRTNEKYLFIYESFQSTDKNDLNLEFKPTILGKFILKFVNPDNRRKYKTSSSFNPIGSGIKENIVKDFINQNKKLIELAKLLDASRMKEKITSPFSKFVKYSIGDSLLIIGNHNLRHIHQAKRVMQNDNFPNS